MRKPALLLCALPTALLAGGLASATGCGEVSSQTDATVAVDGAPVSDASQQIDAQPATDAAPVPPAPLATWELNGTVDSSNPRAVTTTDRQVTAGALSMTGLTAITFADAFVGNGWPAGVIDTSRYMEFSVTASSGQSISFDTVRFSLYNNFDGACTWEVRSNVDGFAAPLDSGSVTSGIFAGGLAVDADVSALGSRSGTVRFRFYTYNNSGTTNPLQRGLRGSDAGGRNLAVWGVVR